MDESSLLQLFVKIDVCTDLMLKMLDTNSANNKKLEKLLLQQKYLVEAAYQYIPQIKKRIG